MGQEEVYEYLKKKQTWTTTKEIAKELDIDVSAVNHSIGKLRRYWLVESEREPASRLVKHRVKQKRRERIW